MQSGPRWRRRELCKTRRRPRGPDRNTYGHTLTVILQWWVDPVPCVLRTRYPFCVSTRNVPDRKRCPLERSSRPSGFCNSIVTSIGPARGRDVETPRWPNRRIPSKRVGLSYGGFALSDPLGSSRFPDDSPCQKGRETVAMGTAPKKSRAARQLARGAADANVPASMEFVIFAGNGGSYHWRLRADDGAILAVLRR